MDIFNSNAILILYDKVCSNLTRPKIEKKQEYIPVIYVPPAH